MEFYILIIITSATIGIFTTLFFIIKHNRLMIRSWINPLKVKSLMKMLKTVFLTIMGVASIYAAIMLILIILRIRLIEPYYSILTSVMTGLLLASMGFVAGVLLTISVGGVVSYLIRRLTTFNYVRMDVSKDIMIIRNNIHELTLILRERVKHRTLHKQVRNEA